MTIPAGSSTSTRAAQRGLTIVELLIGLFLCAIITGLFAGIFADASRSRTSIERAARLMDNAGFAQSLLEDEIRMAGFLAEMNLTGVAWQNTDPCVTDLALLGF